MSILSEEEEKGIPDRKQCVKNPRLEKAGVYNGTERETEDSSSQCNQIAEGLN